MMFGMREARGDARLVDEHRHELLVPAMFGADDLERGEAPGVLGRASKPHARHAALGDGGEHRVLAEALERELRLRRDGHWPNATPASLHGTLAHDRPARTAGPATEARARGVARVSGTNCANTQN